MSGVLSSNDSMFKSSIFSTRKYLKLNLDSFQLYIKHKNYFFTIFFLNIDTLLGKTIHLELKMYLYKTFFTALLIFFLSIIISYKIENINKRYKNSLFLIKLTWK